MLVYIRPFLAAQTDMEKDRRGKMVDDLLYLDKQDFRPVQQLYTAKERENYHNNDYKYQPNIYSYHQDKKKKKNMQGTYYALRAKFCKLWYNWPNKGDVKNEPVSCSSSPAHNEKDRKLLRWEMILIYCEYTYHL